eukprot:TRINITY_DN7077_c0_g1_i1.p1 TRINITY_DN7077_c0_g1~~TRINITY_DN7077_c0_g1_i1.p1  ORF type:complete len:426 (+),score=93.50 TRINITY_DN7077_c0_g1_i1:34-1311(+)
MAEKQKIPNVLIIGTGEYVTGYVYGQASGSDKKIGVVGLVCFDLRRRGLLNKVSIAGTNGTKFPEIRKHLKTKIEEVYKDMSTEFTSYPTDDVEREPKAYIKALDAMEKGDVVMIFTPDDLHYEMCKEAITRGLHVMVTKPAVKELKDHLELLELAKKHNVLVAIEVHKRWDPMYSDAKQRVKGFGNFNYFQSYMSQPKTQLFTFKAWAGKSSDISYYLNSHHVDFHVWTMQDVCKARRVVAMGSYGISKNEPFNCDTEDTITLMTEWSNIKNPQSIGTAVYTASWVASKADVHSQQRFHYMGTTGEVRIDQAHRGYYMDADDTGHVSVNPLYMKYTPDVTGRFSGQQGYGYKSLEEFVVAATQLNNGLATDPSVFDNSLATLAATIPVTAILQAGRMSLDNNGKSVEIIYNEETNTPVFLQLVN